MARKKTVVEKELNDTVAVWKKLSKERDNILQTRVGEVAHEKKKHEAGIEALKKKIEQCEIVTKNLKKTVVENDKKIEELMKKIEKLTAEKKTAI